MKKVSKNSLFETLNLKVNGTVYVKQAPFKVVGYVETVPDLGRALLFGDFAIVSNRAFEKLNVTSIGSFVNYEYKVKAPNEDVLKFVYKHLILKLYSFYKNSVTRFQKCLNHLIFYECI